jgi:hypothetical protein
MKRMIVGFLLLIGCSSAFDIDADDLTRLPSIEQLDYSAITPAEAHRYWELREGFGAGSGTSRILGAGGTQTRAQLDSATIAGLNNTRPPSGFAVGCLPGYCYKYIVAVNGTIRTYANTAALLQFLGPVEAVEEAALIANAHNLYWSTDDPATGFSQVSGGWEIVGLQLVRDCAPVQTDRVHILVRRDGIVSELGREVHSKLENACV